MKLILGSVQFGTDYGISNTSGQVTYSEVEKILNLAKNNGIRIIDTASSYGNSEEVLGEVSTNLELSFITKVSPELLNEHIISSVKSSIDKLKIKRLDGVLLHNCSSLLSVTAQETYSYLRSLKEKHLLCKKIGCSVYSPEEAITISEQFHIDIFQIPANLFDQRIFEKNVLRKIKDKGAEVHIRSLFLQGVMFLNSQNLPSHLLGLEPKLSRLKEYHQNNKEKIIAMALAPFVQNPLIDKLVIGCCSAKELEQIISAYKLAEKIQIDLSLFSVEDENLIDPRKWNL
jgi:aryl-alcohol dehydrogenase-like predicted oxidoreductase